LKIKGLLGGVGWWRTISASILREFGNIRGLQHPWRASTDLLGLQSAERNHAVHCHRRNIQTLRGLQQGDFSAFRQFAFSEDFDFMVIAGTSGRAVRSKAAPAKNRIGWIEVRPCRFAAGGILPPAQFAVRQIVTSSFACQIAGEAQGP
jgi:hypothetical protein